MNEYLSAPDWSTSTGAEVSTPDGTNVNASGSGHNYRLVDGVVVLLVLLALVAYFGGPDSGTRTQERDESVSSNGLSDGVENTTSSL